MSMNLTCEGVELWQTPTYITWMCLSYDPSTGLPDGGHEGVRRRYIMWVESSTDGVWNDANALDRQRRSVAEHLKIVKSIVEPKFSCI
jgi:hypothetical protein